MTDAQPCDVAPRANDRNWPLTIGAALVVLISLLAWFGPDLAPRDPLKPNYIVQDPLTGKFVKPPFPAFTMPGFLLGTDALGRDTLSQLLWAIQPTLILVIVVGALRLVLGVAIGLLAGWSPRWPGRAAETLTSVLLGVPVLFVALGAIAALGSGLGLWAFIIGLSINGWAESARLIAGQTRLIRGQPYVESARAMGASGGSMLSKHLLPHIMPLVWTQLAFEISSAVMTSASLGFLGYFVYSIWVPDGDWSAVRGSGRPELGQMLASGAAIVLRQPWLVMVAGLAVLMIVLGFNLLGEGLRRQVSVGLTRRPRGRIGHALQSAGAWLGSEGGDRLAGIRRRIPAWAGLGGLLILMLGGGFVLWRATHTPLPTTSVAVPGGHLWAAQGRDSQRTFWSSGPGPTKGNLLWALDLGGELAGGPVIASDRTLYITTSQGVLVALNPEGGERWRAALPEPAVFSPALNAVGEIYILGEAGSLSAVSPAGALLWHVAPAAASPPLSAPAVGKDGTAYYATEESLVAIQSMGRILWEARLPTYSYVTANVKLSYDDRWLLFEDTLVDAANGETVQRSTPEMMDAYLIGADGQLYQGLQGEIRQITIADGSLKASSYTQWDLVSSSLGLRVPGWFGVAPGGRVWVLYANQYQYGRLAWLDRSGQVLSMNDLPDRMGTVLLVGMDQNGTAFTCGTLQPSLRESQVECRALVIGRGRPLWTLELPAAGRPVGGALVPNRLYVATSDGIVVAVGPDP